MDFLSCAEQEKYSLDVGRFLSPSPPPALINDGEKACTLDMKLLIQRTTLVHWKHAIDFVGLAEQGLQIRKEREAFNRVSCKSIFPVSLRWGNFQALLQLGAAAVCRCCTPPECCARPARTAQCGAAPACPRSPSVRAHVQ